MLPSHGDGDRGGDVLGAASRQSSRGEANGTEAVGATGGEEAAQKWAGATLPRWS